MRTAQTAVLVFLGVSVEVNSRFDLARKTARFGTRVFVFFAVLLYFFAAYHHSLGGFSDEPLFILLSKSLWRGAFRLPLMGIPMTDPLPGYPLLLALPVHFLGSRWSYYFLIGFFQTAVALYFSWRLALDLLTPAASFGAFVLTCLSPVLLFYSGVVFLDTAYLAVSLILFHALFHATGKSVFYWVPLAALSPLIKPHGVILIFCLAALISLRFNWRKALVFSSLSLIPVGVWLLRNHLLAGSSTGYVSNWLSEASLPQNKGNPFKHITEVASALWGAGPLGALNRSWASFPLWMSCSLGLILIFLFSTGIVQLMRKSRLQPLVFSIALYAILLTLLHSLWPSVSARYSIPLIPLIWIFVVASFLGEAKGPIRNLAFVLGGLVVFRLVALDRFLVESFPKKTPLVFADILDWTRRNTPPSARIDTYDGSLFLLGARRYAISAVANNRDNWIRLLIAQHFDYVENAPFTPDGFYSKYDRLTYAKEKQWAKSSPYFKRVYSNLREGSSIYYFSHPHPDRFLRAYHDFEEAKIAMFLGYSQRKNFVRKELLEAVRLEPTLAYAWAALGNIENSPQKRLYDFERAAKADPTSMEIAADLAQIKAEALKRQQKPQNRS